MGVQVPVLNLDEHENNPLKLRETCEKWGCFRLVNHGVPTKLMAEMKRVTMELLDLPLEIKQRNKDVVPGSGYMGRTEKNPLYEALGLFDCASSLSVSTFCSQLEASPQQRETIEIYADAIQKLAEDMSSKLARSMGSKSYSFEDWPCQFRINKYTFTPETIGSSGVQIHTDSGFLTVLQDDENIGGLEVMDPFGNFVPVDPLPGTLVVNLGDIAVPWSNGRLRSVQHRVQCKEVGLRFSIATFLSPPADRIVEALPEFVNEDDHPCLYVPFTYEEFRKLRSTTKMHAGEALQLVRLHK